MFDAKYAENCTLLKYHIITNSLSRQLDGHPQCSLYCSNLHKKHLNNGLTHLALHPHWNDQTLRDCLLCQMRGYSKTQMISHQRGLPTSHPVSLIDACVWHSLCKGVVVEVTLWSHCGEKFGGEQQARAWRRLRLAVRELEWPLVGHLLGLCVGWFRGEWVHAITKQTVGTLEMQTHMQAWAWIHCILSYMCSHMWCMCAHLINAFVSSVLHRLIHLFLVLQVSWYSPVHLRSHLLIYIPQARLDKHKKCGKTVEPSHTAACS